MLSQVLLALPPDAYAPLADGEHLEPPPSGRTAVSHLAFDAGTSANDQPFLAVGTLDGRVSLLTVTLWRGGSVVAGKKLKVRPSETFPTSFVQPFIQPCEAQKTPCW